MIVKLTKQKAEELDVLFSAILDWEGENQLGHIDVFQVASSIDILSNKSKNEILDLLYIGKLEQQKVYQFFSGGTKLNVDNLSLCNFLNNGGFKKVYLDEKRKKRIDSFRFWSIFILTLVSIFISLYQYRN